MIKGFIEKDLLGFVASLTADYSCAQGVIVAGSSCTTQPEGLISDIDIRVFVDMTTAPAGTYIRKSRYGERVDIPGLTPVSLLGEPGNETLIEVIALPMDRLGNIESLLESHELFAVVYALAEGAILFDPLGCLSAAKLRARREIGLSETIVKRLAWHVDLCEQKACEFLEEPFSIRRRIQEVWNGPIWTLMGAGTALLTAVVQPPTFRLHLWCVRQACESLCLRNVYDGLLDAWGFTRFTEDQARAVARQALQCYTSLTSDCAEKSLTVSWRKTSYYADAFVFLFERGLWIESLFTSLYLLCHCAAVANVETHDADMAARELLSIASFSETDAYVADTQRCLDALRYVASSLPCGLRLLGASKCIS